MRITEENTSDRTKTMKIVSNNMLRVQILVVLVENISEIVILSIMVPNPKWFDRD